MKGKHILSMGLLFFLLTLNVTTAQEKEKLAGIWEGKLAIQGTELRLVFNINFENEELTGTIDSPDQGAKDIPVSEISFSGDSIKINATSVGGYFSGKVDLTGLTMSGVWGQAGMTLPLDLKKVEKVEEIKRPQTPKEPFPYKIEEVFFSNEEDNIKLAGTLTIPDMEGEYPVVILVSGSGAQDRDESLLNHKPFWVLADNLSRNGIGVLRFDDRGMGKSEGDFQTSTTLDFVKDANAAVNYLKNRNDLKIIKTGIMGHSEGGLIAPLVSLKNDDVDFIVLLAGPSLSGDKILELQSELIARATGRDEERIRRDLKFSSSIYSVLKTESDSAKISDQLTVLFGDYYGTLTDEEKAEVGDLDMLISRNLQVINSPWFKYFVTYDPKPALEKITIPVLALYGEKDLQVPAKENISSMQEALKSGGNPKNKVMELKGLNHLFQHSETGSPTEYGKIEETFSPDAINIIIEWIKNL